MITFLDQKYLDPLEVAKALSVTTRTLNRWATDPEGSPERARNLAPITLINGRRVYPAANVLTILNETFGKELTLQELETMVSAGEEKTEAVPRRRPRFGVTTTRAHRRSRGHHSPPIKRPPTRKQERSRSPKSHVGHETGVAG